MNLSIVLVNWNGRELLQSSLKCLPQDIETWVVDNGSSDDSVAYLQKEHPHIKLILNEDNKGFGKANNQALKQITKKYVLMINTDAQLKENCLETLIKYMDDNSDVGLCGARLLNEDGSRQSSITHKIDLLSECLNKNLMSLLRNEERKSSNEPIAVPGVVGAAMLGRHCDLEEVDFFDSDYFFFFEETDLCFRLNDSGHKVMHHPEFVATHAQGKSAAKNKINSRIEYHRSRELFFFKRYGRMQAKKLQLWQERRLIFSHGINVFLRILSLGLYKHRKYELNKALLNWYQCGCPTNQGLKPVHADILVDN
jgi:GT2 family glycosyltransferase